MTENNPFLFHVTDVSYELSRTHELNIDGLSPLYGELDAGASKDENLLVSIGAIAHTSGGYFSLYFLPETVDPRTVLRMIFPTIKRGVRQTADSRVHFAMDALEKWISGDDSVDLRKFQLNLEEATQAVPTMFSST